MKRRRIPLITASVCIAIGSLIIVWVTREQALWWVVGFCAGYVVMSVVGEALSQ